MIRQPPRSASRRLLLVSYHFPPSSEVAGKPTARLVRHLPKFGWEPVVLTIPPESIYGPTDSVGYADVLASARVERVPAGPHLTDAVIRARSVFRRLFGRRGGEGPGSPRSIGPAVGRRT